MSDEIKLPSTISGDGRVFVSSLLRTLKGLFGDVQEVDSAINKITNPSSNVVKPTKPTNFIVSFNVDGAEWQWDYDDNINIDLFELRENNNPGSEIGLLDRVRTTKSTVIPSVRSGTVFLYARWMNGLYSDPVTIQYNKAIPLVPGNISISKIFQGFVVTCDPIPDNCIGATFRVNGEDFFSPNPSFTYNAVFGEFIVYVAYRDIFGDGVRSLSQSVIMESQIKETEITNQSISTPKIATNAITAEKVAANAITAVKIAANTITGDKLTVDSITTRELSVDAVNAENIKAGAITANKIAASSITGDKIYGDTITGDKLVVNSITSDKIAAQSITADKIAAGAITAQSLGVTELSAITAKIGTLRTATTGARTEIKDNLIEVYDANNVLRVRMGVW